MTVRVKGELRCAEGFTSVILGNALGYFTGNSHVLSVNTGMVKLRNGRLAGTVGRAFTVS